MNVILYTATRCPWAARVHLALIEAEVPFDLVEIDLSVPREPWYLKEINPLGKVPALKLADGSIICESSICAEYVAEHSGKLLPQSAYDRSLVRLFIETFAAKFCPALALQNSTAMASEKARMLQVAVKAINDLLNYHFRYGPFFLGSNTYTLAEINCVPFLARFKLAGQNRLLAPGIYEAIRDDKNLTRFNQYLDDCLLEPSHQQIWNESVVLDIMYQRHIQSKPKQDYIFLQELKLVGRVGLSAFSFPDRTFPITVSIKVSTEAVNDNSDIYSISYGDVSREISAIVATGSFPRLEDLSAAIINARHIKGAWQDLVLEKEGGILRAEKEIFEIYPDGRARSSITGMRIGCIIGVYPHERERKQDVLINMAMLRSKWAPCHSEYGSPIEVEEYKRTMMDAITTYVEGSTFKTVEALAQAVSVLSLGALPTTVESVEVWISKPSALTFSKHSGVCVTRARCDVPHL